MVYHKAALVGTACLFLGSSARLIPRAGSWTVGIDPIQAIINQDQDGKLSFDCQTQGRTVISASNIGLQSSGGDIGPQFTSCRAQEQTLDRMEYSIPVGRATNRAATYWTQSLDCQTADGRDVQFDVRVGVDGCAWRLKVPNGQYEVTGETSKWIFAQNGETYLMDDPENTSYEGEWIRSNVAQGLSGSRRVMMPYLADASTTVAGQWILLEEGAVDGSWQGSQLTHSDGSLEYTWQLAEGGTVNVQSSVFTPWRIAVVGDLSTLFQTHFDQDNAAPTNITDMSWIKPGAVAWSWLPEINSPRDLNRQKQYADLAANEGWPFVLVDEGWDAAWVPELVSYAQDKGVSVLLWYHSNQWRSTEDVARNIANMKQWGVKGTKIDFFLSDKQATHKQMDYILSQTAEAQLMVNFHGCPPPRGRQRQWPHLVTVEGIRGDELYTLAFRHTVVPFTRNLIGSADFTPSLYTAAGVFFTEEKQREQSYQCSVGCGLARSIVFESAWQHPGEKPEVIAEYDLAARMYKQLPAVWQSSDLLDGSYPGRATIVGRRSDSANRYYFAGVFNDGEQMFDFRPKSLPEGKTFVLDIVHDSPGDDGNRTAIERTIERNVNSGSSIRIPVKTNGGFTIIACEIPGDDGGCMY